MGDMNFRIIRTEPHYLIVDEFEADDYNSARFAFEERRVKEPETVTLQLVRVLREDKGKKPTITLTVG